MTELRPYQSAAILDINREIAAGRRRILLVAPTGSGKTVIAAALVRQFVDAGKYVLFFSHRREITSQTSAKLHALGIDHGIIQSGYKPRIAEPVQVASVQTLNARDILPPAQLVIVDEAHHAPAATYRKIISAYPQAVILGMTATPTRKDGRGLGNLFEIIVEVSQVAELTRDGWLVPAKSYAPSRPDLAGVKVRMGDYVEPQLANRMNEPKLVADIVVTWLKHNSENRRPTVVFACGVAHSIALRDQFRAAGVMVEHLDGSTPLEDRENILKRLEQRQVEVICNAMVLTEGWDCPSASCVVLARPTKSMGLFRQMAGRVLRPSDGKSDALILDHSGAVFEHGLIDEPVEWTLEPDKKAKNPQQAERATREKPGLTTCPECQAVRTQGQPCPQCGWRPQPKAKPIVVVDGELSEVHRNRPPGAVVYSDQDRRFWHAALLYIANERARQRPFNIRGWVFHKFLEKFGQKPPFSAPPPMVPSAEVRAWVRSRDIAYAKAMQRQIAS